MSTSGLKAGIVVNRMFVGDYLTSNLGHEIINLFQADNGNHYLYLNASGNFHKDHKDKIGTMLMVKSIGKNIVEVIGMAKEIEALEGADQPIKQDQGNKQILDVQEQLIKDIKYAGKPLKEIFNKAEQQPIFVTYKAVAGNVFIPKEGKRIFIQYGSAKDDEHSTADMTYAKQSTEDVYVVLEGYKYPSTSLKSYIYPEGKGIDSDKMQEDYNKIREIIDNPNLWTSEREWKVVVGKDNIERKPNLFEICQIQNDENRLSNALAYFMMQPEYKELWQDFFHSLGILLHDNYTVEREADAGIKYKPWDHTRRPGGGRIDLLIKDEDNIIVIENKIKSGINSKSSDADDMTQLDRYVNFIESETEFNMESEFHGLKPHYFILTPNYNVPKSSSLNKKFIPITYKELYDFLSEDKYRDSMEKDYNFKAFRDILYRHTLPTPNAYLFHEMLEKFQSRISRIHD